MQRKNANKDRRENDMYIGKQSGYVNNMAMVGAQGLQSPEIKRLPCSRVVRERCKCPLVSSAYGRKRPMALVVIMSSGRIPGRWSLMRDHKENVENQADSHDYHAVYGERYRHLAEKPRVDVLHAPLPAPSPGTLAGGADATLDAASALRQDPRVLYISIGRARVVHVVVFLHQTLMVDAFWVTDLVVEKAWEDEADGRGPRAAHKCEDASETGDGKSGYVREY
jgi:hypothetical protein